MRKTVEQRFLDKTNVCGENECWEWKGSKSKDGYGKFVALGNQLAHRVSWIIHNGEIPKGLQVLHECDNPPCVNPKHLFLGTNHDNVLDKVKKGRLVVPDNRGSKSGNAILGEDDVIRILSLSKGGYSPKEISRMVSKISRTSIYDIVMKRTWKHISV